MISCCHFRTSRIQCYVFAQHHWSNECTCSEDSLVWKSQKRSWCTLPYTNTPFICHSLMWASWNIWSRTSAFWREGASTDTLVWCMSSAFHFSISLLAVRSDQFQRLDCKPRYLFLDWIVPLALLFIFWSSYPLGNCLYTLVGSYIQCHSSPSHEMSLVLIPINQHH